MHYTRHSRRELLAGGVEGVAMRVMVLEFNELCPPLMDGLIEAGVLPHFESLRNESQIFVTHAEDRSPWLEPWVQWVSAHSGIPFREHGVSRLGHGGDSKTPHVWDVLAAQGAKSWICGSMNAYPLEEVRGAFLPDFWSVGAPSFPSSLAPYLEFVRPIVQDHRRTADSMNVRALARFMGFMARHGLSAGTVDALFRHVLFERTAGWKRAELLDRLQFDLFRHVYRRLKPDFSTFFSNSTAHFQHHFWGDSEDRVFAGAAPDLGRELSPVFHGYVHMDGLLGKFRRLMEKDTALILCTALSQQGRPPDSVKESELFRPLDPEGLARFMGVTTHCGLEPGMGGEFGYRFRSESDAEDAYGKLARLNDGDRKMAFVTREGNNVILDCRVSRPFSGDERVFGASGRSERFDRLFYRQGSIRGVHHPDGICWIRLPGGRGHVHRDKVRLTALAPTILRLMDRKIPEHMRDAPLNLAIS